MIGANPNIEVICRPCPMSALLYRTEVEPGQSIRDIIGPDAGTHYHISHEGVTIPPEMWAKVRPLVGTVLIVNAPRGPFKAFALAIAMSIAEAAASAAALAASAVGFSAGASVAIGTAVGFGAGVLALAAVSALPSIAMQMIMGAIVKPQGPTLNSSGLGPGSRFVSLTSGRNPVNRFGPLPRLYGRFRIQPPLAANYYTEQRADQQFLHCLFCLSTGPLLIDGNLVGPGMAGDYPSISSDTTTLTSGTMEIGETDVSRFRGVQWQIGTFAQIDQNLYANDIDEQALSVDLNVTGASAIRTTPENTREVAVDIAFPALVDVTKKGRAAGVSVTWRVESSPVGAATWTVHSQPVVAATSRSPVRRSFRIRFSAAGQYDIRLSRISLTTFGTGLDGLQASAIWTALRSIRYNTPWNDTNSTVLAMRIRATGQLNGSLDNLSIIAQSVLPTWNGTAWVEQATSNPAWAYADALRGPQLKAPIEDAAIDLTALQTWAAACEAGGLQYNWYHTDQETLIDRIRAISSTGRASWGFVDGSFSVIRDVVSPAVQMITPRNSRALEISKNFVQPPHALRVRYIDERTWAQNEHIVYDDYVDPTDGSMKTHDQNTATRYEILETQGVTTQAQAFKEGRYFLAVARLRPEYYKLQMDGENLVATRGDTVKLAHDVMLVGNAWGRVKGSQQDVGTNTTTVTVDEKLLIEPGISYGFQLRRWDGTQQLCTVTTTTVGLANVITVDGLIAMSPDDLFVFGEAGRETIDAKISSIEYDADFAATVVMVPAAPEVLTADTAPIPPFDPGITLPPELRRPPAPRLISVVSSSDTLSVNPGGTFSPGIAVQWSLPPGNWPTKLAEVRFSAPDESFDDRNEQSAPEKSSLTAYGFVPGVSVAVDVRVMSVWGQWSDFSDSITIVTVGADAVPRDVASFSLSVVGTQAQLDWAPSTEIDIIYGGALVLRHSANPAETNWGNAVALARIAGNASTATVPLLPGVYFAKWEDAIGRESVNPTRIVYTAPAGQSTSLRAATVAPAPGWAGTLANLSITGGGLAVNLAGGLSGTYETTVTDLGGIYVARLSGTMAVSASLVSDLIGSRALVSTWPSVIGATVDGPTAVLEIATSNDNITYSAYEALSAGNYTARYFKFRVTLTSDTTLHQIVITDLQVTLDLAARTESAQGVALTSAGATITFAAPFFAPPAIGLTAENLNNGERIIKNTATATSFFVKVVDAAGTGVAKTIDWIAAGYGAKQ